MSNSPHCSELQARLTLVVDAKYSIWLAGQLTLYYRSGTAAARLPMDDGFAQVWFRCSVGVVGERSRQCA